MNTRIDASIILWSGKGFRTGMHVYIVCFATDFETDGVHDVSVFDTPSYST